MAFGIDAGMLPHYENWGQFPVMVSVRFTPLRAESATTVAGPLDLDDVALLTPDGDHRATLTDPDNK